MSIFKGETGMFEIGDYVVCPGHGVGLVHDISHQKFGEMQASFYVVKVISNEMKVMVPTTDEESLRKIVNDDEVESVYNLLNDHNVRLDTSTWNRRYKEYMAKVKTGSLLEIAEVLRSLLLLKKRKNLSFGEKKLLKQCEDLLVQEISISSGARPKAIKVKIDSCFESHP